MMDRRTGRVLLCVDQNRRHYTRYAVVAGNRALLDGGFACDRALTAGEIEALRVNPESFTLLPHDDGPLAA